MFSEREMLFFRDKLEDLRFDHGFNHEQTIEYFLTNYWEHFDTRADVEEMLQELS